MGTWVWFFRKWRTEDGLAIPDPVYLESHSNYRLTGKSGTIITPQGALSLEDFLEELLGKPIQSMGRELKDLREEELDTDIRNFSASTVHTFSTFLANEGIHLQNFLDHTDGAPEFSIEKLRRQDVLLRSLRERLAAWRERQDEAAESAIGIISTIVAKLDQGYRIGLTG